MTGRQFEYKIRDYGDVPINEHYTFYRKPLRVVDNRTGETFRFKIFDEALDFVMDDGHAVRDVIGTWEAMPSSEGILDGTFPDGSCYQVIWYIKGEGNRISGLSWL